ncbi:hypothetical protein BV22DRAFT_1038124 [Leucogyrophana mollusca]|uniref:Uncharacterized protein n=1 Tax=Leucogyrophana mollusca TaxID=85980 RepID=A0ACB8B9H2_9AGAM|nr:hypothetical protein BV22DRAFT_1038124 [Leucogyrophana mollusca]
MTSSYTYSEGYTGHGLDLVRARRGDTTRATQRARHVCVCAADPTKVCATDHTKVCATADPTQVCAADPTEVLTPAPAFTSPANRNNVHTPNTDAPASFPALVRHPPPQTRPQP